MNFRPARIALALALPACGADFSATASRDDAGRADASGPSGGAGGRGSTGGVSGNAGGGRTSSGGSSGKSGGSGGPSSTGGVGGAGGTIGSGGSAGSGGAVSSGGTLGSGGVMAMGGTLGSGGAVPPQCTPGALECDNVPPRVCTSAGTWHDRATCGPLMAADLIGMDASMLPGFNAPGFRCKSLAVCGLSQVCAYYPASANLGSLESAETTYTDGAVLSAPEPLALYLSGGAASQCMNPDIDLTAGESIVIKLSTGIAVRVYFPKFSGSSLSLFIREDGATFTDAALTQKAQGPG